MLNFLPKTPKDHEIAELIAEELDPGEAVLWQGRPDRQSQRRRLARYLVISAMTCHGAFLVSYAYLFSLHNPMTIEQLWPMFRSVLVVHIFVTAISSYFDLKLILSSGKDMYAITASRVIVVTLLTRSRRCVYSLCPSRPIATLRTTHADGTSDIVLYPSDTKPPTRPRGAVRLSLLCDGDLVNRLLQETFASKGRV